MSIFTDPNGPPSRNIVILLDGTGNQFSRRNSNLIKLMSVLKVDETQLIYYSSGLGTVLPVGSTTWSRLKQKSAEVIDMGLAWNFDAFVCDAYKFLMDFYQNGDKIYLFGFSRGAYTARALAGMIQRVGLLHAGNYNQIPLAYEVYTGPAHALDDCGKEMDPAVLYRRIFGRSRLVSIEFVGVWDTVSSLGGIDLPQLPFAGGAKSVKFFRHALALDERRVRFTPEYWRADPEQVSIGQAIARARAIIESSPESPEAKAARAELPVLEERLALDYPEIDIGSGQVKNLEVWFMGCHSDVGGGNDVNDYPSLSNVPFRWMLREAVRCGILLDPCGFSLQPALRLPAHSTHRIDPFLLSNLDKVAEMLHQQNNDARLELSRYYEVKAVSSLISQEALGRIVELVSKLDTEKSDDLLPDSRRPIKESLTFGWWPVEGVFLLTRNYTDLGAKSKDRIKMNRGRGRQIIPGQKIHRSVLNRLVYDHNNNVPKKQRYKGPAAKGAYGMDSWESVRCGESDMEVWAE